MKTRVLATWVLGLSLGCAPAWTSLASLASNGTSSSLPSGNFPPATTVPLKSPFSGSLGEIAKLVQTGNDESVLLAFIETVPDKFALKADQIVALRNLGVSSKVLVAMLQHDSSIASGIKPAGSERAPVSSSPIASQSVASNQSLAPAQQSAPALPASGDASIEETKQLPDADLSEMTLQIAPEELEASNPEEEWPPGLAERYPVRKPYPVRLLDTIVVYPIEGVSPNVQVIGMLP